MPKRTLEGDCSGGADMNIDRVGSSYTFTMIPMRIGLEA